jgi:hypothetical protein
MICLGIWSNTSRFTACRAIVFCCTANKIPNDEYGEDQSAYYQKEDIFHMDLHLEITLKPIQFVKELLIY